MNEETAMPAPEEEAAGQELQRQLYGDYISRGTRMIEIESYERVIEGLKMAADRARHLAIRARDDRFIKMSYFLDKMRDRAAQRFGLDRAADRLVFIGEIRRPMGRKHAYAEMGKGLDNASRGAHQLATCFRGDFWWSQLAASLEMMRDKARHLASMRTLVEAPRAYDA